MTDISEPGGFFRITDNYTSNEFEIGQIFARLRDAKVAGGVYLGVGPEQNLTYIAAIQLMMLLAGWLGPGPQALADAMDAIDAAEDAATAMVANPVVLQDMLWRMGLALPVSLVFWHTPALVLWARLPVGKALFFSAVATWRNLGAFVVYGLCWLGALFVLGLLDRLVLGVLPVPVLANALAFSGALALAAAFYASLYFSTVECFESPQDDAGDAPNLV